MIKTKPSVLFTISSLISCEPVSYKHICKGSYSSGDLNDNKALIAAKNGTSSIVGSTERSIRVSIGSSTTFVGCEENFSCSDINSAIICGPDSGSSSTFGSGSEFSITSTALLSRIFSTTVRSSLQSATRSLNCGLSSVEHIGYEDLVRQININSWYSCLSITNKFIQLALFGHSDTSAQVSRRNN